jgi:hypothetical protein
MLESNKSGVNKISEIIVFSPFFLTLVGLSTAVCHDIRDFVFEFSALACFRQKLGDQFCNQCRGTVLRHRGSTNRSAINGDLDRLCAAGPYRQADWVAGLNVLLLAVSSVQPLLACDSGTTSGGLRHALQLVAKLTSRRLVRARWPARLNCSGMSDPVPKYISSGVCPLNAA